MKLIITTLIFFAVTFSAVAQSVGIGTASPSPSAQLDVASTTKGMLIPRMSQSQRNLIPSPEPGLMIYQNDNTPGIYTFNGTAWVAVSNGAANLSLPFSATYSGAANAFNIDLLGNSNNSGVKVATYNSGFSKAITGEARGNGSTGGYFNVMGSPTGATALRTDDGDVLLNTNTGNVGIGSINTPTSQLMITTPASQYGLTHTDGITTVGTYIGATAGWLGTKSAHPLHFFTGNSTPQTTLSTAGLFGIGTTTPTLAGITVNKSVGATYGIFGGNTSGVSLQANFPGIGLNEYYNGGSKFLGAGYGGKFIVNTGTGDLNWYASSASGVADGNMTINQRFGLSREGSMFLQGVDNGYIFTDRTSNNYAGWNLYATGGKASLYRYTQGANTITVDSVGSLGLQGITTMTAPLTLNNSVGNKIDFYYNSPTSRYGIGLQGSLLQMYSDGASSDITFGYGASTSFTERMRIKGNGDVGVGTNNPALKFEVRNSGSDGIRVSSSTQNLDVINGALGGVIGTSSNNAMHMMSNNSIGVSLSTAGLVGIGTITPTNAGLTVNKIVGNTNAIFGGNSTGVSIQSSYPGVGFNTYYNGGSIMIGNGGAGYIGADPTTGRIIIANTNTTSTAGAYNALADKMWIATDGTVSLGSSNLNAENNSLGSGYKLKVFGKIISEEVRVQLKAAWPDYVFEKNYQKLSIDELEKYVTANKHLPNIPSAAEVEKDGQHLGEIQRKMLEKIEELSLYVIELKKEINVLKSKSTANEKP